MSEAWDLLITEMIRHMIREFLAHPAELLTFRKLSYRIASDADVLHAIAEQRPDLFIITDNDRFVKLFPKAVERIVDVGVDRAIAEVGVARSRPTSAHDHHPCDHFGSENEILTGLLHCSFHPDSLARNCCWREICRVRSASPNVIDAETWREICRIRGYLQRRQNPRGF
jgi:hypothetical protein